MKEPERTLYDLRILSEANEEEVWLEPRGDGWVVVTDWGASLHVLGEGDAPREALVSAAKDLATRLAKRAESLQHDLGSTRRLLSHMQAMYLPERGLAEDPFHEDGIDEALES